MTTMFETPMMAWYRSNLDRGIKKEPSRKDTQRFYAGCLIDRDAFRKCYLISREEIDVSDPEKADALKKIYNMEKNDSVIIATFGDLF